MSSPRHEVASIPLPDGGALHGRISSPADLDTRAVLYVHGFSSTHYGEKSQALEAACLRRGWTFAAFDFRGHGLSSGSLLQLHAAGLVDDLARAQGYLNERGVQCLFLVGSSMGGFAAAWFARPHPETVPALATIAGAFDFPGRGWRQLSAEQQQEWQQTGKLRFRNEWTDVEVGYGMVEDRHEFTPQKLADGWTTPALLLHGMADTTVLYTESLDLALAITDAPIEVRLYRQGGHRLTEFKHEIAEAVCHFFAPWFREEQ
jgi:pimeloyl-ACP methyl ester carboxylesterase